MMSTPDIRGKGDSSYQIISIAKTKKAQRDGTCIADEENLPAPPNIQRTKGSTINGEAQKRERTRGKKWEKKHEMAR